MMNTGTMIRILKGCKAHGLTAHTRARVTAIRELGADYSHSVMVSFIVTSGFKSGQAFRFYARHINRLNDPTTNLNDGNPLHKIVIQVIPK